MLEEERGKDGKEIEGKVKRRKRDGGEDGGRMVRERRERGRWGERADSGYALPL